ncbi:MAG TPA: FtsQ-type POTRA domain-containing protein [Pyrinomonadaceae bacterium]|nr:FtsQ-type POTRA domain-containing protein [Pyrinomonadaceae bacterium]
MKKPLSRRRSSASARRLSEQSNGSARKIMLPAFLSFCLLICLIAIGFLGYQTVTASDFFDVSNVEVYGVERAAAGDIRKIVEMQTEKSGVWNADLPGIKEKVERVQWVRTAAVSRVLPTGIRVQVFERVPQAAVRVNGEVILVDADGSVIAPAKQKEESFPFALTGWNETKSEAAGKENVERVKMYQKMLGEWKEFNLSARVQSVDLSDIREPRAFIEDSGTTVSIALGREKFGEYLRKGINAIVGKGDMFEAVNLVGQNMILAPRRQNHGR